ncbi:uncharacterized protein LOC114517535 isoform X2 [Dendronephthya gigantea]|nr:uncharacterized protein LOC114517535 isoform X2 [Dendronephthya gigantea]
MDKDGNGEIDFGEFLNLMTNTEKFLETFEDSSGSGCLETENRHREIMLFEALTQFMKNSALHSMEEIVGYFHSKYKRSQAPHVVGHYAAGARLIGLTEKQLQKHMERIRASNANSTSPYAQPLYNLKPSLAARKRIGKSPLSNCLQGNNGKIRLKFKIDDIKKKSLETKTANEISGVKSAAELSEPLIIDTVMKKPRQPNIKRNGWVSQKAQPLSVHLPTVPLKPKKRGIGGKKALLTFDDLPAIRKKVEKARVSYYKQVYLKKKAEAQQHWESLGTELITSPVCKERFRKVFQAYTAFP